MLINGRKNLLNPSMVAPSTTQHLAINDDSRLFIELQFQVQVPTFRDPPHQSVL